MSKLQSQRSRGENVIMDDLMKLSSDDKDIAKRTTATRSHKGIIIYSLLGLKAISMRVHQIVRQSGESTYKEVAKTLIDELIATKKIEPGTSDVR
jgi:predicted DNA-binding transcriptional regulator